MRLKMPQQQKRILQPAGNQVIYDFYDTLRQTGYKQFYLHQGNSGALFWLDSVQSSEKTYFVKSVTISGGSYWYSHEIVNADLQFNVPVNLKGDCFLNFYFFCPDAHGRCASGAIFKYDGTTETQIGTTVYSVPLADPVYSGAALLKINISNLTHFKIGDKLRVKEYVSVYDTAAPGTYTTNKTIYLETTQPYSNRILIPLKIDI